MIIAIYVLAILWFIRKDKGLITYAALGLLLPIILMFIIFYIFTGNPFFNLMAKEMIILIYSRYLHGLRYYIYSLELDPYIAMYP